MIIISGLVGSWLFAIGNNSLRSGKAARTFADNYCMEVIANQWEVGYLR
jgi:hypothetical protein